jgi:hypothetical protein
MSCIQYVLSITRAESNTAEILSVGHLQGDKVDKMNVHANSATAIKRKLHREWCKQRA